MPLVSNHGRYRRIARGLLVATLTAAYMVAAGGEIPVYEDTTQDMLRARDGMVFGIYQGGSHTTFDGIGQGNLWTRFLAGTFALGLGAVGQQLILMIVAALSMAFFDHRVRRDFGEDIGWAPVGVFLPLLLVAIFYPIATAGYLAPPVLVGSTLALLYVVTRGSTLAACVGGASLAFTAEFHPVTLLGVPVFLLAVAMSCQRPMRALSLGIASGIVSAAAMSFYAWVANGRTLLGQPWLVALTAGALAVALLVAARGRARWLSLAIERRRLLLLIGIFGGLVAEIAVASIVARRMLFMPHYFLFGFPALAILVALGLRRLRARAGFWRPAALAIPVVLLSLPLSFATVWKCGISTGVASMPNYSMREAEIIARYFWAKDYAFPDVQRHLRGPHSLELMGAIAVFAPSADGPSERPMADLRVLAFDESHRPDGAVPARGEEVDLGRGRRAWVLPLDGWVRLAPSRACFEEASTRESKPDCIDVASDSIVYTGRYRTIYERALPAINEARGRFGPGPQFKWELPIEITGDDPERHFDLVGLIGVVPWMIERVEGVAYRGDLPARHVVLERSGQLSGRIVLAAAPSGLSQKDYPPDFLETRPAEAALRKSIRQLPPLGRFICESVGTCPDRAPS